LAYVRLLGGSVAALTVMARPTVVLPTELDAVATYVPEETAIGVPVMTPLEGLRLSSNGKDGVTE
jgi:hypothetical protein